MYTPIVTCRHQSRRWLLSITLNLDPQRRSPQTEGNLIISKYTRLNTFKSHARCIWIFAEPPDLLTPRSVLNSTLQNIQCKTCTRFLISNKWKIMQTQSLKHRHLLCHRRKHTPAPAVCQASLLLSYRNAMCWVALSWTYRTIQTTWLRCMSNPKTSSVGSRRRAWRCMMTTWWRKKTPLGISEASKIGFSSRSLWLACQ